MPAAVQACPLCKRSPEQWLLFAEVRGWRYVRCPECRLVFLNPQPTPEELAQFYNQGYVYEAECYRKTVRQQMHWLHLLARFSPPPGRLLEVGCSYGYFLEQARARGWHTQGIELSEKAATFARHELGLEVRQGRLSDEPDPEQGSYHLLVAWHLLEHETDPQAFLRKASKLLAPGGVLALRVPNLDSAVAQLAGQCWQWLSPPEHTFMFTKETITRFLTASGFRVLFSTSARGNAHNLCFEVLRARTKHLLAQGFRRKQFQKSGFSRPPAYEDRLWYRLAERLIGIGSAPLNWALSSWLARTGREAELFVVAQETKPVIHSGRGSRSTAEEVLRLSPSPTHPEDARLVKIPRWKRVIIRTVEAALWPLVRAGTLFGSNHSSFRADKIRNILVLEYWNLGDIVILLPFLRSLRSAFPEAHISLLVRPEMVALLEDQKLVDELVPFRTPWSEHFVRWQKVNPFSVHWLTMGKALVKLWRRFDLAFTGRMDFRDNLLLWCMGAKRRVGFAVGGGGLFLTHVVAPDPSRPHRSQLWLQLLEYLGKPAGEHSPRLRIGENERRSADEFLARLGIRATDLVVGIHPGARIAVRRWGEENFAAVAARLRVEFPVKVLWFVDPSQPELARSAPEWCLPVSLPFRVFLGVLTRCQLLVCNDSGPMHLATTLGVPVVAVFGPQKPEWFGPVGKRNRVVIRPGFLCRPCFDYCIFDQPYCLRTIPVEEVYESAASTLDEICSMTLASSPPPRLPNEAKAPE